MENLPTRTNDPGDLKNPQTGQFNQFSSPEEGLLALASDLHSKMTGATSTGLTGSSTLKDFASVYAPASDGNNPDSYASGLATDLGVDPSTPIGQLDLGKFSDAVAKQEGFQGNVQKMSEDDFANKIKQKYPQYQNLDNQTLTQKVLTKYPQYQVLIDPNLIASSATKTPSSDNSVTGIPVVDSILNFALPIVSDIKNDFSGKNSKSGLQQAADAALSVLPFIPGLGELGEAGRAAEAGADVAKGASAAADTGLLPKVLKGAATGYGFGTLQNISNGQNVGQALMPNAGNLLGAATGGTLEGVLGKLASSYSGSGVIDDLTKSNNSILGQTKRGANDLAESFAAGKNPGELIANKGINLAAEYDPETLGFSTLGHAQDFRNTANTLTDTLTQALRSIGPGSVEEGTALSTDDLRQALIDQVTASAPDKITASEQTQLINDEFDKIQSLYGDTLSAADLNELKKRAWNESAFDTSKTNLYRKTQRVIGNKLKTNIENIASNAGLDGVGEFNDYIGSHLDAANALEGINGNKVKGGRLGDLMKKNTLTAVGGVGGFFGGGPVGSLVGALAGDWAGGKLSTILRKIGSSPLKTAILNKMEQEDPEIVQKVVAYAEQNGGKKAGGMIAPLLKKTTPASSGLLKKLVKVGAREATRLPAGGSI